MKLLRLFSALMVSVSCMTHADELRIYNWYEYIPDDVISDFEKETGTKVIYDAYDSQEAMEAKLLTGVSGYDLAFSGAVGIDRLIQAKSIVKLDKSKLSNLGNIGEAFMKLERSAGDTSNEYAVPYLWGTNIIGYNKEAVEAATGKDTLSTWDDILALDNIKKLSSCGVTFLDSPSEIMPIFLSYLGLPPDSTKKADYEKVEDYLKTIRPYIRSFNSSTFMANLADGEVCVAVAWSGALAVSGQNAAKAGKDFTIDLTLPESGAPVWFDSMVIPAGAPNEAAAHKFIDYLMRPEVIARCSNMAMYANPNTAADSLVDEALSGNAALYPTDEIKEKLYPLVALPLKAEKIRTRAWTKIKTDS